MPIVLDPEPRQGLKFRGELKEKDKRKRKLAEPKDWAVILLNDDYTTMDFVVAILMNVFHKGEEEATSIMLSVHQKGRGLVGYYAYDIALTKQKQVHELAQKNEFPLRCVLEQR
jgi:ATP-dependent Clp protease adaptor protein ClpS